MLKLRWQLTLDLMSNSPSHPQAYTKCTGMAIFLSVYQFISLLQLAPLKVVSTKLPFLLNSFWFQCVEFQCSKCATSHLSTTCPQSSVLSLIIIWWGLIAAGIAGNEYSPYSIASAGVEILEEIPNPDVVIVCCGGGGLVSGVAASIKLKGSKATRIFAVEPEGGGWIKGHVR